MKTAWVLAILLFACGGKVQSQQTLPAAARAGVYTARTTALHLAANQALLGTIKRTAIAVYSERPFLLQALSQSFIAMAHPVGDGAAALQLAYSGDADYAMSKIGLAYGRNLTEKISIGVQFNYGSQRIRGYGQAAQVSMEGGVAYRFSDKFQSGFQWSNIAATTFTKATAPLPTSYTIGAGYQPAENVSVSAELSKTGAWPVALQAAVSYQFATMFWARAGINSNTTAFFIAGGFRLGACTVEIMGSINQPLGFTPGLLLTYNNMGK